MSVTLATLRTEVLRRADMLDPGGAQTDFLSEAEVNSYINKAGAELHDILVTKYEDYFTKEGTVTIAAAATTGALPSDFYKLRAVEYGEGTELRRLRGISPIERSKYAYATARYPYTSQDRMYMLYGTTFQVVPYVDAPGTYTLLYAPRYAEMTSDADTLFDPAAIGDLQSWHEYVIIRAAIDCLEKEESFEAAAMRKGDLMALRDRIEKSAPQRDASGPRTVCDDDDIGTTWGYR